MKVIYQRILLILVACICIHCGTGNSSFLPQGNQNEEIPLLVITDFGRDVDDAQTFAFLAALQKDTGHQPAIKIAGVITTGYIPQIRTRTLALFLHLSNLQVPIVSGSAFSLKEYNRQPPITGKDSINIVARYLQHHSLNGEPYEITLLKGLEAGIGDSTTLILSKYQTSQSPKTMIDSLLTIYPNSLRVLVLAQPTDLAKYTAAYPQQAKKIHSVYIQGQAYTKNNDTILPLFKSDSLTPVFYPDYQAYNLREDSLASEIIFTLQKNIPFTFITKYAAYKMQIGKNLTEQFAAGNNRTGVYLKEAAYTGLKSFYYREPELFCKIFNIEKKRIPFDEILSQLQVVNNPYDLLTAMAVTHPEVFDANGLPLQDTCYQLICRYLTTQP